MTSHTPGPWEFYADSVPVDHKTYKSPGYYDNLSLFGPNGEFIAGCDEYEAFSHNAADRSLIAAAPELLEALKYAREEIALRVVEDGGTRYSIEKACRKIDAAIAKAEGR